MKTVVTVTLKFTLSDVYDRTDDEIRAECLAFLQSVLDFPGTEFDIKIETVTD